MHMTRKIKNSIFICFMSILWSAKESRETGVIEVCPSVSYGGENLDTFKDYINQN